MPQYCRGCKCTADATLFISNGKQYKQCTRCRTRIHDRKRSAATVVCDCGREVLRTSLRDHLRTLYHEKRMIEKRPAQNEAQDVARKPLMRRPMPAAVSQQPKPVSATATDQSAQTTVDSSADEASRADQDRTQSAFIFRVPQSHHDGTGDRRIDAYEAEAGTLHACPRAMNTTKTAAEATTWRSM